MKRSDAPLKTEMDKIIFPRFVQNSLPLALIVGGVIGLWGIFRGVRAYREENI